MKTIKKSICAILFVLVSIGLKAQDAKKWHELLIADQGPYQAKGITVKLFKERYSGLEGQQYTVVFTNISAQKLKIKGSLSAQTYCGNSLSISFETTIKPGESLGGKDYLMDDVGLTGTVHSEDCKTDKIYPDPNDKTSYKYDRIRALQLGALNINAVDTLAKTTANIGDQSSKQTNNLAAISKPAYKPLTTSSGNAKQTTVQKQRQQQANNYVNAANNSTDDIQKATDLSLANINAVASGNKAQAAQIQQMQNLQAQQNINNLGNQLIGIINKPKPSEEYHKSTKEEEYADIDRQVRSDLEKKGYVFDANGKTVGVPGDPTGETLKGANNRPLQANLDLAYTEMLKNTNSPKPFNTKYNLSKGEEKVNEIKKWILSKLKNNPGKVAIDPLVDINYLVDESRTDDERLTLLNYYIERSNDNKSIIDMLIIASSSINWASINAVKFNQNTIVGTTTYPPSIEISTQPNQIKTEQNGISYTKLYPEKTAAG